ncbi:MAG: hypothetical protein CMH94_10595 [Oceanicaulis sp.]|nr:hypothetical protein [Oceanicaulis sp.]
MAILRFFVGLLLISASLAACGPEPRRPAEPGVDPAVRVAPDEADPVVARVDGTVIRRSDVER